MTDATTSRVAFGERGLTWSGLLCLMLLAPAVLAVAPDDHVHRETSCSRCHELATSLEILGGTASEKCQQCHADPTTSVAAAPGPTIREGVASGNRPLALGMSVPLYYDPSRFGSAPGEMVPIPAGEFLMGSDERLPDEGPRHTVTLPAYFIDKYEVTNLQYKAFIDATKRRSPRHFRNRSYPPGKADHPVVHVSWDDAQAYCAWAGKRLPTDAEWEKAARGTDGRWFPWGNEFDPARANTPLRWQQIGHPGDTTPVGAFEQGRSPYGVYDMSGNVWEWTSSWYKAYPGNQTASESYGERYRTLKGGSWFDCSFYNCGISAPAFNRAFFATKTRNDSFGFRCARDGA